MKDNIEDIKDIKNINDFNDFNDFETDASNNIEYNDLIKPAKITGTLVWYYCICKKEVWLMARNITVDQENELLDIDQLIKVKRFFEKSKDFF